MGTRLLVPRAAPREQYTGRSSRRTSSLSPVRAYGSGGGAGVDGRRGCASTSRLWGATVTRATARAAFATCHANQR